MRREVWPRCVIVVLALGGCKPPDASVGAVEPPAPTHEPAARPDPVVQPVPPAPAREPMAAPVCPGAPECPPEYEPLALADEDLARIRSVQPIVARAAAEYGVDPHFVNGVIWVESKFHARARGPAGARGMMQLMPRTSRSLAKKIARSHRPYDPEFNIFAGTYYLSRLLAKFDGDERLALAGYSRGAGRVKGWVDNGQPLPGGTERFIRKVMRARATFVQVLADDRARSPT